MLHGLRALSGQSHSSIERHARATRAAFRIGPGRAPGIHLFEGLDEYTTTTAMGPIPLLWDIKEDIPTEGLTHFKPDAGERGAIELVLREDVYQALRRDEPRARFTLMHELAHALLHAEDLVRRGRLPHFQASFRRAGGKPTHRVFEDTEWQANVWASAFLMPARELLQLERTGALRASQVQLVFGVSAEAAACRLATYMNRKGEIAA